MLIAVVGRHYPPQFVVALFALHVMTGGRNVYSRAICSSKSVWSSTLTA